MNTADQQWEADIRQKVEQHEFAFDPQAWEAMEQLLDQPVGNDNTAPRSSTQGQSWWKWLLPGLIAIGLLLFLGRRNRISTPPTLSSFSVRPYNEEVIVPSEVLPTPHPSTTVDAFPTPPQTSQFKLPITAQAAQATDNISTEESDPIAPTAPRTKIRVTLPLPHDTKLPLLQSKNDMPDFEIKDPKTTTRRRDRRTLFPDVIRKY